MHAPGSLGELFVLFWIYFLVAYPERLSTRKGLAAFAGISMLTALSYLASLVQILPARVGHRCAPLCLWRSRTRAPLRRGPQPGLLGAFVLYYAPYAVAAAGKSGLLLDRATYDPPATFFFLRNQMRDTVRILMNGYPLYLLLALGGYLVLPLSSGASRYHRQLLAAAGLTYVLMLLLKDPLFFPMIFLHAKEDLFFAPVACLLGASFSSYLWSTGRPVVSRWRESCLSRRRWPCVTRC